jgi:hypothetical protein
MPLVLATPVTLAEAFARGVQEELAYTGRGWGSLHSPKAWIDWTAYLLWLFEKSFSKSSSIAGHSFIARTFAERARHPDYHAGTGQWEHYMPVRVAWCAFRWKTPIADIKLLSNFYTKEVFISSGWVCPGSISPRYDTLEPRREIAQYLMHYGVMTMYDLANLSGLPDSVEALYKAIDVPMDSADRKGATACFGSTLHALLDGALGIFGIVPVIRDWEIIQGVLPPPDSFINIGQRHWYDVAQLLVDAYGPSSFGPAVSSTWSLNSGRRFSVLQETSPEVLQQAVYTLLPRIVEDYWRSPRNPDLDTLFSQTFFSCTHNE